MHAATASAPPRRPLRLAPLTALGFWIFTYLLLSIRAEMLRGDGFDGLSLKRVVATLVGAVLLGVVLAATGRGGASAARRPAILGTIFPASAAVFAARVTLDYFYYGQPLTLADDVRWVLVWAGYFGLWLSAALALSLGRERTPEPARTAARPAASVLPATREPTPNESWEWLVEVIAEAVADAPRHERAKLAERLLARAGYDSADDLDPEHGRRSARLALARQIAARLQT